MDNFPRSRSRAPSDALAPHAGRLPFLFATPPPPHVPPPRSGSATGDTISREAEAHRIYLDYYRALAIDQEFYWFTLQAAPADGMHWMTDSEMAKFSVYTHLR